MAGMGNETLINGGEEQGLSHLCCLEAKVRKPPSSNWEEEEKVKRWEGLQILCGGMEGEADFEKNGFDPKRKTIGRNFLILFDFTFFCLFQSESKYFVVPIFIFIPLRETFDGKRTEEAQRMA